MFRNYLLTSLRHLWHQRTYTALNLGGLTVGLTVALLLLMWVQDERSYDRMHARLDNLYRVNAVVDAKENLIWSNTQGPVAPYAKREVPGVADAVRVGGYWNLSRIIADGTTYFDASGKYVDASFFTAFSFPMRAGDAAAPFPNLQSVVVTEAAAARYFNTTDALGKVISTDDSTHFTVSGVLADLPTNSTIQGELFFPFRRLYARYDGTGYWKDLESDWGNYNYHTYLLLDPTADPQTVAARMTDIATGQHIEATVELSYRLQPLADLHLYGPDGAEAGAAEVRIFFGVALIILLIAAINYVNLTTARATHRAREVGVRKVIGAGRGQLFGQFLGESALMFLMAVALTLLIVSLLMPLYNELSGKELQFNPLDPAVLSLVGGAFAFTLLPAGIYPALLLSGFRPTAALKGQLRTGRGTVAFRRTLVVTQFVFSIVLIAGTLVITRQMRYVREMKLGFDREHVLTVWMNDMRPHYAQIRDELLKHPAVRGVTTANQHLIRVNNSTGDTDWEGKPEDLSFILHPVGIDARFIDLMGIEMVAGRGFTGAPADSVHVILNETTVRRAGITDPIGKRFSLWDTDATI
ncbi:MAG: ABC transporter permease, partial [Catalinimonas sp.]